MVKCFTRSSYSLGRSAVVVLVDLAAISDPTNSPARDACVVRDRSLRVAAIETIEDHECRLEVIVRRGIALGVDVEPERRPTSLLAKGLRSSHALAGVFALDVSLEFGEGRGDRRCTGLHLPCIVPQQPGIKPTY